MVDMKEVLSYIDGSKEIEHMLTTDYIRYRYPYVQQGTKNRSAPLFTKVLYEMILEKEGLPCCTEFEEKLVRDYFPGPNRESAKSQANLAYKALLTDIHFYFILQETGIFDSVEMSLTHDVFMKSDILLGSGDFSMGLQLFSGDAAYERTKRLSLKRIESFTSYPIHLFRLKSRKNWKDAEGKALSLYEEEDAYEIFGIMQGHEAGIEMDLVPEKGVDRYALHEEEHAIQETDRTNAPRHSIVFGGDVSPSVIDSMRIRGIKVYHIPVNISGITPFTINDGVGHQRYASYLKEHGHLANRFNYDQYVVEHADIDESITINAGAGSGKTTTLIARILFLLNTGAIKHLGEVAMITFTNEAVNNMEAALAKELVRLTRQTGDTRFLKHLNELRRMDILTIPSFAKNILNQYGQHIGLGSNVRISGMTMERRMLIDEVIDEKFRGTNIQDVFSGLWYYRVREFVEKLWDKFEQKGLIHEELERMDSPKNELISSFVATVIDSDKRLDELKKVSDILGVSDLTRYLKRLVAVDAPLFEMSERYKYLLVDEFQDTDISQISFIANLVASTDIRLIVVGDVKQGIYRFRGADSSAFTVLQSTLANKGVRPQTRYQLDENFRSSKRLVEMMENHFVAWRSCGLLPGDDGAMFSRKMVEDRGDAFFTLKDGSVDMDEIKSRYDELPENSVLAILVRENSQAEEIGKKLRQDGRIKNYEVRMDGTLFLSEAAKDLLILLGSWIFPKDKKLIFSLDGTAFSFPSDPVRVRRVGVEDGQERIVAEEHVVYLDNIWSEAQVKMKHHPLLPVIDHFLENSRHLENLRGAGVPEAEVKKYELNLQKILLLAHEKFADEPLDILKLYNWLDIQVSTNREDDEADIEDWSFEGNIVRVLTVHRSKGLQFDTVMIPYTSKNMVKGSHGDGSDIIVFADETGDIEYGWRFVDQAAKIDFMTENYFSLKKEEDEEQIKEECRLLYVAMTRAISRIFVYEYDKAKENDPPRTWGDLLRMGGREDGL